MKKDNFIYCSSLPTAYFFFQLVSLWVRWAADLSSRRYKPNIRDWVWVTPAVISSGLANKTFNLTNTGKGYGLKKKDFFNFSRETNHYLFLMFFQLY